MDKILSYNRVKIFKRIFPLVNKEKNLYGVLVLLKIISIVLSFINPIFYMLLINNVMVNGNLKFLPLIILGYSGVFLLQTIIITINKKIYNKVFIKFNLRLRTKLLSQFGKFKIMEYEKYSAGDIKNRIETDAGVFEKFLTTHSLEFVFAIISAIVLVIVMIYINWFLALFSFIMVPFSFQFAKFMSSKAGKVSDEYRNRYGEYESFIHSSVQNWMEIKANNQEKNQTTILATHWKTLSNLFVKKQIFWHINRSFIEFKDFFITKMNLYFLGGILIIHGKMEVALLLTFMNYYEQFFNNISLISDSIVSLKSDLPSIERVIEVMDYNETKSLKKMDFSNKLTIEEVYFRYPSNEQNTLNGINLIISRNEHIAIVGRSGCGKSTLIKVILGLYEPNRGKVLIDEFDVKDVYIGGKIGVIMQEPMFFNLSIRENLKFAKRNATQQEIDNACKKANIYDFIQTLPDKYETSIGERGVKLSGGQKQRLAIARTILLDPEIIIFDEATSSLDYENEKAIVSSIKVISKNKTVITIAHRLSSILDADRVLVMEKGKIIACGQHETLKDKNEIYDLLFAKQYSLEV